MESSRRIAWVDYAKGIAIIGVFILHSNAPEGIIHAVNAFCMPLFFYSPVCLFNPQVFLFSTFPME
jgi:acyltransferase